MADPPIALVASLDGPPGAPVLVLGNSLGTSRAVWEPQVPAFSEWFRLLRFELPGHGGAPAQPGAGSIAALGTGVLALLDDRGIERASYCGISLGGMIGMWLAAHAPERIGRLGLVCTSAYLPPAEGWLTRAETVRRDGMSAITGQSVSRWFTPEFAARFPDVIASFTAGLNAADPDGYGQCCRAIAGMDLRPELASISAPTLVISGEFDPATPPGHGAAIASGIGQARHLVIPGTSHLGNVDAAAAVTEALLDHLRRPADRAE